MHLSRRLKYTFVIMRCPSSVRPSSLTFHIFDFFSENRIQQNLTGSKISTASSKFVFFRTIGKTKWPPWHLIGWDIFDSSSETAERYTYSTKLDRKQDLNVLNQVCVIRADKKTRWPPWPLIDWDIFDFSSETAEKIQRNLTRSKISTSSTKFVFFGLIRKKTRWPSCPLIGWDIFDFSSETAERNSTKHDRKQDLNVLYQFCVFRADRKKQDGCPGLWLAETFSSSPLKPLNGIQRNMTGSKISTSSTNFVFFQPIGKTRWLPWPSTSPLKPLNRIQRNLTESKISISSTKFLFFGSISILKWPPRSFCQKKVAHCTQVHDMWPFGPLVYAWAWGLRILFWNR